MEDILLKIGVDVNQLKKISGVVRKELTAPMAKIPPEAQKSTAELAKTTKTLSMAQVQVAKSGTDAADAMKQRGKQASITSKQEQQYKDTLTKVNAEEKALGKTTLPMVTSRFRTLSAMKAKGIKLNKAQSATLKRSSEQLSKASKSIDDVSKAQRRGLKSMVRWALGWTIMYGAVRIVQNIIKDVLVNYGQLDDTMARVASVTRVTGQTQEAVMQEMRSAVLDYARTSRAEITEVAKALYFLGSAGLTVSQQMAGFDDIMNLVIGTVGSLDQGAKLVAGAFNVFGQSMSNTISDAERFKKIADVLAFTYSTQQVELADVASAFTLVGSAAGLLDIGFTELVGTIGFLNTGMLKGTRAGTSLLNAFVKIAQNADKLRTTLGITFDPTQPLNFVDIMEKIYKSIGSTSVSTEQLKILMNIFGLRGARAVANIINRFDEWKNTVDASEATFANFAERMRGEMEDTLPAALKELGNTIKIEMIEAIEPFLENIKDIIDRINKLDRAAKEAKNLEKILEMLGRKPTEGLIKLEEWPKVLQGIAEYFGAFIKLTPEMKFPPEFIKEAELFKALGLPDVIKEAAEKGGLVAGSMTRWQDLAQAYRNFIIEANELGKEGIQIHEELLGILSKTLTKEQARIWAKKGYLDLLIKAVLKEEEEKNIATVLIKQDRMKLFALQEAHQLRIAGIEGLLKEELLQKELASRINQITFGLDKQEEIRQELNRLIFEEQNVSNETIFLALKKYGLEKEALKLLKIRHKIEEELRKEIMQTANIFETEVSEGIWNIIQRSGEWLDIVKNIGDEIMKMSIEEVVKKVIIRPIFDIASEKMVGAATVSNIAADKELISARMKLQAAQINAGVDVDLGSISVTPGKGKTGETGKGKFGGLTGGQWLGAGAAAYSIAQSGMGPARGAMAGGMMGMQMGGPWGAAIGVVAGGLLGLLGQGKKQEKATIDQTKQITSLLKISARSLDVINRNLVALREAPLPYAMPESAFFASASQRGFIGA